nr:MAG TPA: hypothetical protein [Caudoviricetes sp.]
MDYPSWVVYFILNNSTHKLYIVSYYLVHI